MSIIENVQRSDLNCVEEALAYFNLMETFKITQEEVAKRIGKERSTIANFLRLLKLPKDVIMLLKQESLSFGHGKVLASLKDDKKISRLALEAAQKSLSVRDLEKLVKQLENQKISEVKHENTNTQSSQRLNVLKETLEKKTGFHFDLKEKSAGKGFIQINYSNEAELNDIYEYLLGRSV
jgi:ParB family chromosome partitioning protein